MAVPVTPPVAGGRRNTDACVCRWKYEALPAVHSFSNTINIRHWTVDTSVSGEEREAISFCGTGPPRQGGPHETGSQHGCI